MSPCVGNLVSQLGPTSPLSLLPVFLCLHKKQSRLLFGKGLSLLKSGLTGGAGAATPHLGAPPPPSELPALSSRLSRAGSESGKSLECCDHAVHVCRAMWWVALPGSARCMRQGEGPGLGFRVGSAEKIKFSATARRSDVLTLTTRDIASLATHITFFYLACAR